MDLNIFSISLIDITLFSFVFFAASFVNFGKYSSKTKNNLHLPKLSDLSTIFFIYVRPVVIIPLHCQIGDMCTFSFLLDLFKVC